MAARTEIRMASSSANLVEDLAQQAPYKDLVRALMCLKGIGTLSAVTLIVET